ncbi:MAG: trimethylamine methyltransferase family protein, partial [Promethearchaeota archaeon]
TARLGSIESIMLTCAYTQMAKHYGIPTHGYLGLSDSKIGADYQSGFESTTGLLLGALAGVNNIAGAGMLCFESTQSFEKLLLDDVVAGMAKRLLNGVGVNDATLAIESLREVGMKGGDFLRLQHTLKWFKKEHYMPGDIVDRQSFEAWKTQGGKSSHQRAQHRLTEILSSHDPKPLNQDQQQALDEIVRGFMKRHKSPPLPFGPK